MRNVLVTGAKGFIGANLCITLERLAHINVLRVTRETNNADFEKMLLKADLIFHLAGVNRSSKDEDFVKANVDLTEKISQFLQAAKKNTPIIFSSSSKSGGVDIYGETKFLAESCLKKYHRASGAPVYVLRFPNVFGKWSRPNYNSVVATFCFNIARDKAIQINEPDATIRLLHIGDVVTELLAIMSEIEEGFHLVTEFDSHELTVGELAETLNRYHRERTELKVAKVGAGFARQLYATFISYLPQTAFKYSLPENSDHRGKFVEMLKTVDSGQIGYFTALPGVTRGGHYHNVKVEKFLVVSGLARFRFENISTKEVMTIRTSGGSAEIVESIPGWSHDVTNLGDEELVVLVWANEIFDSDKPDTVSRILRHEEA